MRRVILCGFGALALFVHIGTRAEHGTEFAVWRDFIEGLLGLFLIWLAFPRKDPVYPAWRDPMTPEDRRHDIQHQHDIDK